MSNQTTKESNLDRSRLGKRLACIERELSEIKETLAWLKPKRGLKFSVALPPQSVCKDLLSTIRGTSSYDGFIALLSSYYQVSEMRLFWDEKRVPAKAMACYFGDENAAYCKAETIDEHTVLHEFFHHLVRHGVVVVADKDKERRADEFATIILERGRR